MKRKKARKKLIPFLIAVPAVILALIIILLGWRSNARKIFIDYGMEVEIVQEAGSYTAVVSHVPSDEETSEILLTVVRDGKIAWYKLFRGRIWAYIQNDKYFILNGTEDSILIFNTETGDFRYVETMGELHYLINDTLCIAYPGMDVWEFEIFNLKDGTSRMEDDHYQPPARASTPVDPEESVISAAMKKKYTEFMTRQGIF